VNEIFLKRIISIAMRIATCSFYKEHSPNGADNKFEIGNVFSYLCKTKLHTIGDTITTGKTIPVDVSKITILKGGG